VALVGAIDLEYLEEALQEAEAAARWYAERSPTAAAAFTDEIDAAETAIVRLPEAWPPFDHETRRYLLRRFPFSVVYRIESQDQFAIRWPRSSCDCGRGLIGARYPPAKAFRYDGQRSMHA
jgi:plasmid stabilization system protein ParE